MDKIEQVVFWLENFSPKFKKFEGEAALLDSLKFMEILRKQPDISHVVLSSENSNNKGKLGVAEANKSYSWTKRRTTYLRFSPDDSFINDCDV